MKINWKKLLDIYMSHKWRINRLEYILIHLWYVIIFLIISLLIWVTMTDKESINLTIVLIISVAITSVLIYSLYCVNIKRLHDMWKSWWWSILIWALYPIPVILMITIPWNKWKNKFW